MQTGVLHTSAAYIRNANIPCGVQMAGKRKGATEELDSDMGKNNDIVCQLLV